MRAAGRVVAEMHVVVRVAAKPGVTTAHLNKLAADVIERRGATSNFFGYHGFPAVICTSVNDAVVHGIPSGRVLLEGDVLSVDCGAIVNGWHGDAAFTMGIGSITAEAQRLIDTADAALAAAIRQMRPGNHLGDVGHAIGSVVAAAGFGNPVDFCGHGIGRAMHEDPDVENRGRPGRGLELFDGVVLAIEPMLIAGGGDDVLQLADGWTVVTADGSLAAHAEHTVLTNAGQPEILTRP